MVFVYFSLSYRRDSTAIAYPTQANTSIEFKGTWCGEMMSACKKVHDYKRVLIAHIYILYITTDTILKHFFGHQT